MKKEEDNLSGITVNGEPLNSVLDEIEDEEKTTEADEVMNEERKKPRKFRKPIVKKTERKEKSGKPTNYTRREIYKMTKKEEVKALLAARKTKGNDVPLICIILRELAGREYAATVKEIYDDMTEYCGEAPCKYSTFTSTFFGRLLKSPFKHLLDTFESAGKGKRYVIVGPARDYNLNELLPLCSIGKKGIKHLTTFLKRHERMATYFPRELLGEIGLRGLADKPVDISGMLNDWAAQESPPVEAYEEVVLDAEEVVAKDVSFDDAIKAMAKFARQFNVEISINLKIQ